MNDVEKRLDAMERRLRLLERSSEDRIRVLETLYRLQEAIDGRDWDTIRATFTPDGSGYGRTGVDAIVTRMRDHLGGCGPTQHLLGNVRVTLAGDTAWSVACARVYHMGAGDKEGRFFECIGEYDDHWVRDGDDWRLASRDFQMRILAR
jgi:3-phenylpropionate/cinnamic acid dioxygenase small subunit